MHEDFEKLQKEFKQMEADKKVETEKVEKAKADAAKKEKEEEAKKAAKKGAHMAKKEKMKDEIEKTKKEADQAKLAAESAVNSAVANATKPISPVGLANGAMKVAANIGSTLATGPKPAAPAAPPKPAKAAQTISVPAWGIHDIQV